MKFNTYSRKQVPAFRGNGVRVKAVAVSVAFPRNPLTAYTRTIERRLPAANIAARPFLELQMIITFPSRLAACSSSLRGITRQEEAKAPPTVSDSTVGY